MADVFISYHISSASHLAHSVSKALEQKGLTCWFCESDVQVGGNFAQVIPRQIDACKVFLLLLDKGAVSSIHVGKEVTLAFKRKSRDKAFTVIPFLLEKTELDDTMRYYLSDVQIMKADVSSPLTDRIASLVEKITEIALASGKSDSVSGKITVPVSTFSRYVAREARVVKASFRLGEYSVRCVLDTNRVYLIGRAETCNIRVNEPDVSRVHCHLKYQNGAWRIRDGNPDGTHQSANGTFVNGRRLLPRESVALHSGDVVFAVRCPLIMGAGFLEVPQDVSHTSSDARRVRVPTSDDRAHEENYKGRWETPIAPVNRAPIDLKPPPELLVRNRWQRPLRFFGTAMLGVQALLGNPEAQRELFPAVTEYRTEGAREGQSERQAAQYRQWLEKKEEEITQRKADEASFLRESYLSAREALDSVRLPAARREDSEAFLHIRLGVGKQRMMAPKHYQDNETDWQSSAPESELAAKFTALAEREEFLLNVPVTLSLLEHPLVSLAGDWSKDGETWRRKVESFTRNIVLSLAAEHFCTDVKIVLLSEPLAAAALDFLRFLPHNWTNDRKTRLFAENREEARKIAAYLGESHGDTDSPVWVVVSLSQSLLMDTPEFRELMKVTENGRGRQRFAFLTAGFEAPPQFTTKIQELKRIVSDGNCYHDSASCRFMPDRAVEDETKIRRFTEFLWEEASGLFSFAPDWPTDGKWAQETLSRRTIRFLDDLGTPFHAESAERMDCETESAPSSVRLINVLVPRLQREYDLLVPEDMDIQTLRRLLETGVRKLAEKPGELCPFSELIGRCPDRLLSPDQTLRECGLRNGAQAVLL